MRKSLFYHVAGFYFSLLFNEDDPAVKLLGSCTFEHYRVGEVPDPHFSMRIYNEIHETPLDFVAHKSRQYGNITIQAGRVGASPCYVILHKGVRCATMYTDAGNTFATVFVEGQLLLGIYFSVLVFYSIYVYGHNTLVMQSVAVTDNGLSYLFVGGNSYDFAASISKNRPTMEIACHGCTVVRVGKDGHCTAHPSPWNTSGKNLSASFPVVAVVYPDKTIYDNIYRLVGEQACYCISRSVFECHWHSDRNTMSNAEVRLAVDIPCYHLEYEGGVGGVALCLDTILPFAPAGEDYGTLNETAIKYLASVLAMEERVTLPVHGESMKPFLRSGMRLELIRPPKVSVGDIVLAHAHDIHGREMYVLHRVIFAEGDDIRLMGDGVLDGIEYCRRQDIIGFALYYYDSKNRSRDLYSRKRMRLWCVWHRLIFMRQLLLPLVR